MANPIENELGLGPAMHRVRRWSRNMMSRIGKGNVPEDQRLLDPLTVNYAAWREVRRTVREWPQYKEAANSIEILVSPEDWEDYWGIDAARKEAGVAAYVLARAAEKGYWMSGDPQVFVVSDDAIDPGDVEVVCQFVEPVEDEDAPSVSSTVQQPMLDERMGRRGTWETGVHTSYDPGIADETESKDAGGVAPTIRFVDAKNAGEAYLTDKHGFRLVLNSGDIIGAVQEDEYVDPAVNVRLDAAGFPYADAKQCQLGVVGGRWTLVNYAEHGTMLVTTKGERYMLVLPEPYPLQEGDVVYLGPKRPLRFELSQ